MPKSQTSSDVELMRRFVKGDESSFEILVERYEEQLLNFFFRLTRNRQASEDLTQETFFRLIRSKDAYRVKASFRTFVYRIARNLWIDRYRSKRARPQSFSLSGMGERPGDRPMEEQLEGNDPHPGERLESDEARELLSEAVDALPETQREVFVLWLETGMKYAEISKVLGVPVGTIKSRMHTAIHSLKDKLQKRTGE